MKSEWDLRTGDSNSRLILWELAVKEKRGLVPSLDRDVESQEGVAAGILNTGHSRRSE